MLFLSLAALGVGLAVLGAEAGRLSSYVGSSGIGHALAGGWLVTRGRGALGRPAAIGLLAVLAFKVSWELATGAVAVSSGLAGAVPVPAAHAAGLALGCALAPIAARAPRRGRPKALAA